MDGVEGLPGSGFGALGDVEVGALSGLAGKGDSILVHGDSSLLVQGLGGVHQAGGLLSVIELAPAGQLPGGGGGRALENHISDTVIVQDRCHPQVPVLAFVVVGEKIMADFFELFHVRASKLLFGDFVFHAYMITYQTVIVKRFR